MKAIIAAVAAGLVVLAIAAPTPIAAPEASPTLTQFNALKRQVNTLKSQMANVRGELACIEIFPVSLYGVPPNAGYLWVDNWVNPDITTAEPTTALDITDDGDPVDYWVAYYDDDCVDASGRPELRGDTRRPSANARPLMP